MRWIITVSCRASAMTVGRNVRARRRRNHVATPMCSRLLAYSRGSDYDICSASAYATGITDKWTGVMSLLLPAPKSVTVDPKTIAFDEPANIGKRGHADQD